jgi:predicted nucleic acid-binding protein
MAHHVPVIGSIGVLIRARLDGVIPALQPVLDQLMWLGSIWIPRARCTTRRYSALARSDAL